MEHTHAGRIGATVLLTSALVVAAAPAHGAEIKAKRAPTGTGVVQVVQAVPKTSVAVVIDGKAVKQSASAGSVLGPYRLSAGTHQLRFRNTAGGVGMRATLKVKQGSSTDVVLHSPASAAGKPVVNVYTTPRRAIAAGKARVVIAHTATVAPADVRVDGKVIFENIANGEYATADVAAGAHQVALLPTGRTSNPLLGPLTVKLPERTVTMVYAVGSPKDGSMAVIAHDARIAADGSVVPEKIDTGSAGLVAGRSVRTFSSSGTTPGDGSGALPWLLVGASLAAVALLGSARRVRRTAGHLVARL